MNQAIVVQVKMNVMAAIRLVTQPSISKVLRPQLQTVHWSRTIKCKWESVNKVIANKRVSWILAEGNRVSGDTQRVSGDTVQD
jgi:hypothetical protein